MPISTARGHRLARVALWALVVASAGALAGAVALTSAEKGWATPQFREPEEAFRHGTIGTELMPLVVAEALPDLFPHHFTPPDANGQPVPGDWIDRFGFLRAEDGSGLPVGFAVTNYRPQSASPSPVPFVGFSCALCHTTRIEPVSGGPARVVTGPGSGSLNLFAWVDAFQASILEREGIAGATDPDDPAPYRLTVSSLDGYFREKKGRALTTSERIMVSLWLKQMRTRLLDGLPRFDDPAGRGRSFLPADVPTGPTRTQPFRTIVRQALDRPGNDMAVYTKVATVFSEDLRTWAQFDGTIADLHARSSLAAFAAGATVENMRHPEIAHNIRAASEYTRTLRPPKYADLFPKEAAALVPARVDAGRKVYRAHCYSCHGDRPTTEEAGALADAERVGNWKHGPRHGAVVPLAEIGTDPERVMFRHYGQVPEVLFRKFPEKHPFHFAREVIRPERGKEEDAAIRGYVNAPLDGMFLRAPYLHNASVMTLRQLIHLDERPATFHRGRNKYDPVAVGFVAPPDARDGNYFKLDTTRRGNSNAGHDYPWSAKDAPQHKAELDALLDYLKTL